MDDITKNRIIELPCNFGDEVYFRKFVKSANVTADSEPKIVKAEVEKIEIRVSEDIVFKVYIKWVSVEGFELHDWYLWHDGYLFTNELCV